jgi:ABC-2 type transport system permease protein
VTTAQGAIVREKQLGTAAWVLSKPVSGSAFVLAKFVFYTLAFVSLAVLLPSAIFYGESLFLAGHVPELVGFLSAVGIMVVHTATLLIASLVAFLSAVGIMVVHTATLLIASLVASIPRCVPAAPIVTFLYNKCAIVTPSRDHHER